ncbi:MAG: M23 family metallopeptidase [Deltaproteobacteria bacterium]|nr:M23 family metallopeptidase [Deltaproteobacteria bacterium]
MMRSSTTTSRFLKLGLIILTFFLLGFLLGYLAGSDEDSAAQREEIITPVNDQEEKHLTQDEQQEEITTVDYTFKQRDTFYEVLLDFGIPPREIFSLIESSKKIYNLKRVKPGNTMALKIDPVHHTVVRLEFSFDGRQMLVVTKTDQEYLASKEEIAFDSKLRTIAGTIKNSLFEDATKSGCSPQLILNFADIFAWDVDFLSDLRENDSFKLLFEEIYKDGDFVRYGKILAAEFTNQGERFRAFYFENDKGRAGYYNDEGKSVDREFLKSPLRYSRISSRFSKRRFHPVLRIYRPHSGVDYAAPTGTPAETTCDGKIIFIGWKKDYGKCIKIRHNHIYTSYYGHLSRFAKGMKLGKRVKQGQVIGYVGATGLATGPHLDYRLKKRGKFIDPLKFRSPRILSISKAQLPQFEKSKRQLLAMLGQFDEVLMLAKAIPR